MMTPVNKHTVLKQVRDTGKWMGYIAPSNANGGNIDKGWHLGMSMDIQWDAHSKIYYVFFSNDGKDSFITRKLDDVLNEFLYYNCNNELGKRIRYWEEK
jgi:hypothetical protein